ncbi:hypothetical protein OCU04_006036 [Sclerotinia nivalis]|uniref:Uncharacterized protein n=1 Tax=Sclerotinia nivalis TaxID=352851 RepID=A0A9X0AN23_9HELO|nr:hypothetical protein OCU04_006036 [Sclerotinia nivalis]
MIPSVQPLDMIVRTVRVLIKCGCKEEEENNCPADGSDEQPVCTENSCQGQDGKCTTGQYQGCDCEQLECPDISKGMFLCIWCGGKTDDGKCKGDPDDDYELAGCDCQDTPDWNQPPPCKLRPNASLISQKLLNLPDIVYDPPVPTSSAKSEPSCDQKEPSGVPWNVFSPGVYTSFCENMRENKTNQVGDVVDSEGNSIPIKAVKLATSN